MRVSQGTVSDRARLQVVRPRARGGSRGTAVRALQRRLKDLGYLVPVSGRYDGTTARAVLAFRKVNGFSRITSAGRTVFRRLARGGGGFKVRYPKAEGKHAEFDWSRQILGARARRAPGPDPPHLVRDLSHADRVRQIPLLPQVARLQRQGHVLLVLLRRRLRHPQGTWPVPTFPASHGCLRIPIASAKRVYGWVSLGDPIYTYR